MNYKPIPDITKPLTTLDRLIPNYYVPRGLPQDIHTPTDWRDSLSAAYIYPGPLVAGTGIASWRPTSNAILQAVYATVGLSPNVGHTWFDVKRNGVSLLSGEFLTILRDTNISSKVFILNLPLVPSDIITIDVLEDNGARDATVYLMYQ